MEEHPILMSVVVGLFTGVTSGVIAGLIASQWISRFYEFKAATTRACYPLRLFPHDADHCIAELRMCKHQLWSQGFTSAADDMQRILDWAEEHRGFRATEKEKAPPGKRFEIMPLLENLRPTIWECTLGKRKTPPRDTD